MDVIGLVMGVLTIPMALLSIASLAAGAVLLALGDWRLVLAGLLVAGTCLLLARPLERLVIAIDDRAALALDRRARARARLLAALSGATPMLVILLAEVACLRFATDAGTGTNAPAVLVRLWAYGVATGPWTLFAGQVSRFRRTLAGIRAYAGHVALWLFTLALAAGASPALAGTAMLVPAILPFAVGMLLALADRDALTNVRI